MNVTDLRKKLNGEIILVTKFGSDLYGTSTPQSDTDYKGIYMPSPREIALGKIPKSVRVDTNTSNEKNTSEDVDCEIYSLHYFLELAIKGETVALDMLHTIPECIVHSTPLWDEIVRHRRSFYTKNLKSFVGYARKQAAKYGVKGSRLDAAKEFMDLCYRYYPWDKNAPEYKYQENKCKTKMVDIWEHLPLNDHARHIESTPQGIMQYQICGKVIQHTMSMGYAHDIVKNFYDKYGARAKLASENKGVDWKAMSHAIRAALQVKQLLEEGTITFPLKAADDLRYIKMGLWPFEVVIANLEALMEEVDRLTEVSTLPEEVNRKFWDDFLYRKVKNWFEEYNWYNGT